MEKKQRPTVKSFLDMDFYKFTMGQFIFHRYANIPVVSAFRNRTRGVNLAEFISEGDLREELDRIQDLRPTKEELGYLGKVKNGEGLLFKPDYLDFLDNLKLPAYKLTKANGNYELEFEGPWAKQTYWETLSLAAVNELYYRALTKDMDHTQVLAIEQEGDRRLEEKLRILEKNPLAKFMEFGTRRRFSQDWQEDVVTTLRDCVPNQMVGTSNVYLAMKYGLAPKGTMAHEVFMVMSGIMHGSDEEIRASHNKVLQEWWEEYGAGLSIALTDTYGSEFFFKDMTEKQAREWKGFRQDSGSPRAFANKQIQFYEQRGINPLEKYFVPSDGLEIGEIVGLPAEFESRINTMAGWGTSLTNDLGLKPLSLVVKAVEANGNGTVKLSDNPAKAMGKPEDIQRFMRIFEYDPNKYVQEECKY